MSTAVFTPKQIAQALGVSESSVKRWVDSGRLPAAKTVGGHRKVPLPSIADFLRSTGHPLAEPAVLGMVAITRRTPFDSAVGELFEALVEGRESACREIVLSYYQRGETIAAIGDRLIGPAFRRIGDGWAAGTVAVHQERRSCEVVMAVLHELRRWVATPEEAAPLALVATPHMDFAEVPVRLVELTLLSLGWRVVVAGSGLPLGEIADTVVSHAPRLVCLSVTHVEDQDAFARDYTRHFLPRLDAMASTPAVVVGGTATADGLGRRLASDLRAGSLAALVEFQGRLR